MIRLDKYGYVIDCDDYCYRLSKSKIDRNGNEVYYNTIYPSTLKSCIEYVYNVMLKQYIHDNNIELKEALKKAEELKDEFKELLNKAETNLDS